MDGHSHFLNEHLPPGNLRNYDPKALISRPDDRDNRVFALEQGEARICLFGAAREQTLGYLQVGSIYVTHTSAWVEALTHCTVRSWPIHDIRALFAQHPEMALGTLREVGKMLQNAINLVEDLAFRSVESRLARYLLTESEQQQSTTVRLIGSIEVMASLLGTSRQTLSTLINRLAKQGVISRPDRHHVTLIDQNALEALTDKMSAS